MTRAEHYLAQCLLLVVCIGSLAAQTVQVWLTTPNQNDLLSPRNNLTFDTDRGGTADVIVDVDDRDVYQKIDGFGGDMTESSAWLMTDKMDAKGRQTLLRHLFVNIRLNIIRLPMGSSEFSIRNYTYDDTCCDLSDFSVDKDKVYMIPLLKEVLNLNPDSLIFATSYSPPSWMKNSESLIGGNLKKNQYSNLATYFTKFMNAYQKSENISIYAIVVQNRPLNPPCCSPGMKMNADEQGEFVRTKLGPVFRKYDIKTKILLHGQGWDDSFYPIALLNDPEVKGYASGTAFSCDGNNVDKQSVVHTQHPDRGVWLTECMDGTWIDGGNFASLFSTAMHREIIGGLRNWARGVAKGSFLLDENRGPTNGGCLYCLGLATLKNDGSISLNAAFYALGHVSKFVGRGAVRIHSTSFDGLVETVAFVNQDGSKVLVAFNRGHLVTFFKVRWSGDKSFFYNLPSRAAVTFVWSSESPSSGRSPYDRIEAESGVGVSRKEWTTYPCDEIGGGCGEYVTGTGNIIYRGLDFGNDSAESVTIRVSSLAPAALQFQLDSATGPTVALIKTLNAIEDLGKWCTISRQLLKPINGVHNLYVVFRGRRDSIRLNWFIFNVKSVADISPVFSEKVFYKIIDSESELALTKENSGFHLRRYGFDDNQKFRIGAPVEEDCLEIFAKNGSSSLVSKERWKINFAQEGYVEIFYCSNNMTLTTENFGSRRLFSFVAVEQYETIINYKL